jgi:hypothetical protein
MVRTVVTVTPAVEATAIRSVMPPGMIRRIRSGRACSRRPSRGEIAPKDRPGGSYGTPDCDPSGVFISNAWPGTDKLCG